MEETEKPLLLSRSEPNAHGVQHFLPSSDSLSTPAVVLSTMVAICGTLAVGCAVSTVCKALYQITLTFLCSSFSWNWNMDLKCRWNRTWNWVLWEFITCLKSHSFVILFFFFFFFADGVFVTCSDWNHGGTGLVCGSCTHYFPSHFSINYH